MHDAVCFILVFLATICTCAYADASEHPAAVPVVEIIIERRADSVEVYFGGNAEALIQYFGANPDLFTNSSGHVPFNGFQSGTWLLGDALLRGASLTVGGVPIELEATSLMMHPATLAVPFEDAIDAVMAVSICAVINPPSDLTLQDASLYAGFIAFTGDAHEAIVLKSPEDIGGFIVGVRDHANGTLIGVWEQTWAFDEPISLRPVSNHGPSVSLSSLAVPYPFMGLVLFLGLLGSGAFILARRARHRPVQAPSLPPN
ncbi:MAG: hypothetical protein KI785_06625 [Devosiaceae bacterium]|nr:hypothetical protein [Devosiaceae bacterium MH13]